MYVFRGRQETTSQQNIILSCERVFTDPISRAQCVSRYVFHVKFL